MAKTVQPPKKKKECLNPNTGGKMLIDADVYDLFTKAIKQSLKTNGALTYSELVVQIKKYFSMLKMDFNGSVEWYTVAVKNDMEVRQLLEVYTEKSRKLHRLKEG